MELQIINTEEQYEDMLKWVDGQFDLQPDPDSPAGSRLQRTTNIPRSILHLILFKPCSS